MVQPPEHMVQDAEHMVLSESMALISCSSMALFYVAILYAPTLILRLPPPSSFKSFLIRRFICAAISSAVSLIATTLLLPVAWEAQQILAAFGIRLDHMWQAVVYPLILTSLMYAGSLIHKALVVLDSLTDEGERLPVSECIKSVFGTFVNWMSSMVSDVGAWRNYFVAPVTEELVFRACMIPLLLCGGFSTYAVILLCPIFFSLAHLNHFLELYTQQRLSFLRASSIVFNLAILFSLDHMHHFSLFEQETYCLHLLLIYFVILWACLPSFLGEQNCYENNEFKRTIPLLSMIFSWLAFCFSKYCNLSLYRWGAGLLMAFVSFDKSAFV